MHSSPSPAAAPLPSIASVYFYSFADGLFLNDLLCVSVYKFIDRASTCARDRISTVNSPMRDYGCREQTHQKGDSRLLGWRLHAGRPAPSESQGAQPTVHEGRGRAALDVQPHRPARLLR
jgi:hypothetical protein